tara:strand:- start:5580 stop:5741 length:162 start_codon:yes stop_codon:yes gene_type:complete
MAKCITEYIDDWCRDTFGHTNWEFYNVDNESEYYEKYKDLNIAVFKKEKKEQK